MVGKLDLRHFSRRRSVAAQQLQRVVDVHRRKSTPCRRSNRCWTPRASQRSPPTRQPHVPPLHSTGPVATHSALVDTKATCAGQNLCAFHQSPIPHGVSTLGSRTIFPLRKKYFSIMIIFFCCTPLLSVLNPPHALQGRSRLCIVFFPSFVSLYSRPYSVPPTLSAKAPTSAPSAALSRIPL